ncbi:MAG: peptide ABC transporter substrate-binding protein, partial [Bacteriovoracaceae bacterium]|nr:peptide ABC transporter substrate-binding protein [Bacteriovoracaceae bacterium]
MKYLSLALIGLFVFGCQPRPKRNIAFYTNILGEPTTLHPLKGASDGYTGSVTSYIIESLLTKDIDTYEWKPSLATEWEISEDKKTFTFKLRKNVKWHDGKPFTAEDVKWSFDAIFDDKYKAVSLRPYYEGIEKVEVLDSHTVRFVAKTNYYKNFDIAAGLEILPKHFYEQDKGKAFFNKNVIGTGPYKLELYKRGSRVVLLKNEQWWGFELEDQKEWNFPKIVVRFVGDQTVALEMLKKGSLDFLGLRPEAYVKKAVGPKWGKEVHKVRTYNKSPKGYNFIGWNLKHDILKDKKVRQALYHLVNRKLMIDKFEFGYSVPAAGPIYPDSPYHDKSIKPVEYDPKKALKILREAGWRDTDGDNVLDKVINGRKRNLSITILEPYEGFMKYLTVFKEDAKKA